MKTVKQIKKKIKKNRSKKRVKIVSLNRRHFKKTLSTNDGFGFQDLKKKPKKLITDLMCESINLHFIPKGDPKDMDIDVYSKN